MRSLVDLGVPAQPERAPPSLRAFLELAFRPLYLAGMAWALIAIGIWVCAPQMLIGPLQGVAWHAHEMLWGFPSAFSQPALHLSAAAWIAALALYLWRFAPLLIRPRS